MDLRDGGKYTLAQLLGDKVTLVIPDLQRDYSWGDNAKGFILSLIDLYSKSHYASLGLIQGCDEAPDSSHFLVIDGHQRLTTLYLLLGMLHRRTPTDMLRRLLISDYQMIDSQQPRLQYQSRREAEYFLSDLVMHFFLDRNGRLSQLEQSAWFFRSYLADGNVCSFIQAIRGIDAALEKACAEIPDWDFSAFADFVAHNLRFTLCHLGTRSQAEQSFLTLNVTSQPLALGEKMRARFITAAANDAERQEIALRMNEIEDWHWLYPRAWPLDEMIRLFHRMLVADGKNPSYGAFSEFFDAYSQAFEAAIAAEEWLPLPADETSQSDFALMPAIAYAMRFRGEATAADMRRFWHILANMLRYQRATASGTDAHAAMRMVDCMLAPDVISLLDCYRLPERVFPAEEKAKLEFIAQYISRRDEIEEIFACGEAHPMLNGRIAKVIAWSAKANDPVETIAAYVDAFYRIWGTDLDRNDSLDTVRRALLTLRSKDYPIVRRGDTVLSLCWHLYDWQRLMLQSPGLVRQFIERAEASSLEEMIARHEHDRTPCDVLIKHPEILARCRKRQLLRINPTAPLSYFDYHTNRPMRLPKIPSNKKGQGPEPKAK